MCVVVSVSLSVWTGRLFLYRSCGRGDVDDGVEDFIEMAVSNNSHKTNLTSSSAFHMTLMTVSS